MDEKAFRTLDIVIKGLGFLATAVSIFVGVSKFNRAQQDAAELEFNRSFWQNQNAVYAEVCRTAGSMAANFDDPVTFEQERKKFVSLYYGAVVLVEDSTVDSSMRELRSFLGVIDLLNAKDEETANRFNQKVLDLANACKRSSEEFKKRNLE